ncbi:hypothetical protein BJV82DRAFT_670561 [Fennellomyces sp. T-0311]|nr:hypothetical protein BJV82DRAFT_670561 [Fennellomyces sp. T-0311]
MLGHDPGNDAKRLNSFLQECRTLGGLRGFKHFEVFMRGREELLLLIPSSPGHKYEASTLMPKQVHAHSPLYDSQHTPRPERMPINPSDQELKKLPDTTVLLITGYSRYKCPYIYIRSSAEEDELSDAPLHLETTEMWRRKDVPLWEMVLEVLGLVMTSCPSNPFQLDHAYLEALPVEESVLLTGALLNFLQNIWIQADPSKEFVDAVYEDIKALQTRHLSAMYDYTTLNFNLEQQVAN